MSSGSYQGGAVPLPSPWLCINVHITLKTINILKRRVRCLKNIKGLLKIGR
jgi:hypothetical protein